MLRIKYVTVCGQPLYVIMLVYLDVVDYGWLLVMLMVPGSVADKQMYRNAGGLLALC